MASEYDKIHSNPLRVRILDLIRESPATKLELAKTSGAPLSKVMYHTKVLEDAKAIRPVETELGAEAETAEPTYEARYG
jgi:DNA-binding transcriptional ArsR family regulator